MKALSATLRERIVATWCGLLVAVLVCLADGISRFTTEPLPFQGVPTALVVGPHNHQLEPGQIGHVSTSNAKNAHIAVVASGCAWKKQIQAGPWKRSCIRTHSHHDRYLAVVSQQAIAQLPTLTPADKQVLADGNILALASNGGAQNQAAQKVAIVEVVSTGSNGDNWPAKYQVKSQREARLQSSTSADTRIDGYRYAISQQALPRHLKVTATQTTTQSAGIAPIAHNRQPWLYTLIAAGFLGGLAAWCVYSMWTPTRRKRQAHSPTVTSEQGHRE